MCAKWPLYTLIWFFQVRIDLLNLKEFKKMTMRKVHVPASLEFVAPMWGHPI